jgi:Domain of unknown function (DUF305)
MALSPQQEVAMTFKALLAAAVMIAAPCAALADHATSAEEAFKEANDTMMHNMMQPMTGDPDKDFVMMMLPHHQGAIDMAKVELEYGKDRRCGLWRKPSSRRRKKRSKRCRNGSLPILETASSAATRSTTCAWWRLTNRGTKSYYRLKDCSDAQGTPAADPNACAEIPSEPKGRRIRRLRGSFARLSSKRHGAVISIP